MDNNCTFILRKVFIQKFLIITSDLYCASKCRSKLRGAGYCTSEKRMTSILKHVAEAFPPARQGTIIPRTGYDEYQDWGMANLSTN